MNHSDVDVVAKELGCTASYREIPNGEYHWTKPKGETHRPVQEAEHVAFTLPLEEPSQSRSGSHIRVSALVEYGQTTRDGLKETMVELLERELLEQLAVRDRVLQTLLDRAKS